MKTKNSAYLVLTIIFVILSVIGGYFLYQISRQQQTSTNTTQKEVTPTPVEVPVETPIITIIPIATTSVSLTPTKKIATPTATLKPTSTPKNSDSVETTSSLLNFQSSEDGFSIDYLPKRKLYQDTESSGNRYTFYLSSGNFAVHVGLNDKWAWTASNRDFSGDFLVAGLNTYRYDISTQTIVDLQYNGKNYTLQCVHNGNTTTKAECEEFLQSFKLL